jgi:hypothetical protein
MDGEKDDVARLVEMLIELQSWLGVAQDVRQLALAFLDRLTAQVRAVELQQVEGDQNGVILPPWGRSEARRRRRGRFRRRLRPRHRSGRT